MPKKPKKITAAKPLEAALEAIPHRAGLPAKDSVIGVTSAPKYTIIHTLEADRYDKGATSALGLATAALAAKAAPADDDFGGTDRKAAKLSVSDAETESFDNVSDLIATLPAESKMKAHKPPISTAATSGRVKEEDRNIHVDAFIYAASREKDNDFHLIVGMDPDGDTEMYMTMEISGLPDEGDDSFAQIKSARDEFKQFFEDNSLTLPPMTYDFYNPPLKVTIEGSLFFDMTHAKGGGPRPGPSSLKGHMPVIWEVHPVSTIVFK